MSLDTMFGATLSRGDNPGPSGLSIGMLHAQSNNVGDDSDVISVGLRKRHKAGHTKQLSKGGSFLKQGLIGIYMKWITPLNDTRCPYYY